jgi:hypothetical protein
MGDTQQKALEYIIIVVSSMLFGYMIAHILIT